MGGLGDDFLDCFCRDAGIGNDVLGDGGCHMPRIYDRETEADQAGEEISGLHVHRGRHKKVSCEGIGLPAFALYDRRHPSVYRAARGL